MFVEGPEQSFWHCFEDVTNWWRWGGGGGGLNGISDLDKKKLEDLDKN